MTEQEFAEGYASKSGVTVEWLREHGMEARPCDCGEDGCKGWQMAHILNDPGGSARLMDQRRGIPR